MGIRKICLHVGSVPCLAPRDGDRRRTGPLESVGVLSASSLCQAPDSFVSPCASWGQPRPQEGLMPGEDAGGAFALVSSRLNTRAPALHLPGMTSLRVHPPCLHAGCPREKEPPSSSPSSAGLGRTGDPASRDLHLAPPPFVRSVSQCLLSTCCVPSAYPSGDTSLNRSSKILPLVARSSADGL